MLPPDALAFDIAERFGIGPAARPLLREALALMHYGQNGVVGFLDRLRRSGLGAAVASWGDRPDAEALNGARLEEILGTTLLCGIAGRVGLDREITGQALGYAIPRLIGSLNATGVPDGAVPPGGRTQWGAAPRLVSSDAAALTGSGAVPPSSPPREESGLWGALLLAGLAGLGIAAWLLQPSGPPISPPSGPAWTNRIEIPLAPDPAVKTEPPPLPAPPPPARAGVVASITTEGAADLAAASQAAARSALAALPPNFGVEDVLRILNAAILNFANGSFDIPANAEPMLKSAAARLKALPAGTRVEVAGYTDATGELAANLLISTQRAIAVRDFLGKAGVGGVILIARGYGAAHPVMPNDTPEGRFRNRRIEYRLVPP